MEGLRTMPCTEFEDLVTDVVGLAGKGPFDTDSGFVDFSSLAAVEEARSSDLNWKLPVRRRLESAMEDRLLKLQTIMYAGRDHLPDIGALHTNLSQRKTTRDDLIRILENPSIGVYLVRGWEILLNSGLDPEGQF
jgi:hypothetical protein